MNSLHFGKIKAYIYTWYSLLNIEGGSQILLLGVLNSDENQTKLT